MEYYTAKRKKKFPPFITEWMEPESIMLSEISQAVKDKYHMISPISGTHQFFLLSLHSKHSTVCGSILLV